MSVKKNKINSGCSGPTYQRPFEKNKTFLLGTTSTSNLIHFYCTHKQNISGNNDDDDDDDTICIIKINNHKNKIKKVRKKRRLSGEG